MDKTLKEIAKSNSELVFDSINHKYSFQGKELKSVTRFIEGHAKKFEPLYPSINKAKSNKKKGEGITDPVKLRAYWRLNGERKRCIGTASHNFAEMYILDRTTPILTGYDQAIVNVLAALENNWEIIGAEQRVFSLEYLLAGTYDLKIRHKITGEYGLVDWKVTEDMFKSYGKLKKAFSGIPDSPLNKYIIQLRTYAIMDKDDIKPEHMFVVQLRPDATYNVYKTKDAHEGLVGLVEQALFDNTVMSSPLFGI